MAFSKAHRFAPGHYHLSLLCAALAHPARVCILERLMSAGEPLSVKTLHRGLPISLPALSQHLKILRDMYIVNCEVETPTVYYRLNEECPEIIRELEYFIARSAVNNNRSQIDAINMLGQRRTSGTTPG